MEPASGAVRERLPAHPASVGSARRLLRRTVGDRLPEDTVDTAELLVSELVTNAVVHAGTPVELEVAVLDPAAVLVQVTDGSAHRPTARTYDASAGTGRGLILLEELSDRWGVSETGDGKTVWFCIAVEPTDAATASGIPPRSREPVPDPDTIEVQLGQVPLHLHAQWQAYASALLREYLLVSLDGGDDVDQVVAHAACSDALSLLREAVPLPVPENAGGSGGEGDGGGRRGPVTLQVPKASVAHFAVLDETLDRAVGLADRDATLNPSSSPAMRRFRRWVCSEVLGQAQGRPPVPWQP